MTHAVKKAKDSINDDGIRDLAESLQDAPADKARNIHVLEAAVWEGGRNECNHVALTLESQRRHDLQTAVAFFVRGWVIPTINADTTDTNEKFEPVKFFPSNLIGGFDCERRAADVDDREGAQVEETEECDDVGERFRRQHLSLKRLRLYRLKKKGQTSQRILMNSFR